MANTISNMKMTNPIKGLVSKRRKRYTQDGFNLDLAYITDNLIAMGFPAERLEGVYRNHIDDVFKFLEQKHKDHYKIYNLCSERSYDSCKFHKRVATYPFDDHNPPKIELIQPFCEDVDNWLRLDARNVAAVHCKAGKGRTGTMVCCYLLHSGQFLTASDALNYYGQKRTHDKKGVTIPSQRRCVEYYAALVSRSLAYRPVALIIRQLSMQPPPTLNGGQCTLEFAVSDANNMVTKFTSGCVEVRKGAGAVSIRLDRCTPLAGDVKVELYNRPKMMMGKDKLFHFWFNTFFVASEVNSARIERFDDDALLPTFKVCLDKWQLDDAHKDKQHRLYSSDFKVELIVQQIPSSSPWSESKLQLEQRQRPGRAPPRPPSRSPSTTDDSSEDSLEEEGWESGEHLHYSSPDSARSSRFTSTTDVSEPGTDEPVRFQGVASRPRLSLGDVRASLREFSGKLVGSDAVKHKKNKSVGGKVPNCREGSKREF